MQKTGKGQNKTQEKGKQKKREKQFNTFIAIKIIHKQK